MSEALRQHFLKEKEKRLLLNRFFETFGIDAEHLFGSKPQIEVVETSRHKIFIINSKPLLAESGGDFFPTLAFKEFFSLMPRVVVDMGAVPYICNGADVMAPGIVKIHGDFKEENLVVVSDEKYGKPIAVGRALFDSKSTKTLRQGKVFKNLHHVGDEIWSAVKKLVQNEKVKT